MAEEKGALIREDSIEGLKFWLNFFDEPEDESDEELPTGQKSQTGRSLV